MIIKFKRSPIGYGYSYRAGSIAASLPDKDAKYLVEIGIAEDITPKPKAKKPPKATVQKTVVK
jgi:hypothetical protein